MKAGKTVRLWPPDEVHGAGAGRCPLKAAVGLRTQRANEPLIATVPMMAPTVGKVGRYFSMANVAATTGLY